MTKRDTLPSPPNPAEMAELLSTIAEQTQRVCKAFMERTGKGDAEAFNMWDPRELMQVFEERTRQVWSDPAKAVETQMGMWRDYVELWQRDAKRMLGDGEDPVAQTPPTDRRFSDEAWQTPLFDHIKQTYLLLARHTRSQMSEVSGLDEHTVRKLEFQTRQLVDAMSPSNFAFTNPEVVRATLESGGENLVRGFSHMLEDIERGRGCLNITTTDADKFRLGENVAATPGKVMFENDLMQLIQYQPATDTVYRRPLLIIPPWINKYYILDLRPKNSFIKWAVEQGHTVFVISWVNPDASLADKSFEDYMLEGPLAALDAMEQATGENAFKVIGYCLGGTLLASTLAYMAVKKDDRIRAATFFVSMVDFSEPGELGVFIDEAQLAQMEAHMASKGYLEGESMAQVFSLLRANDLIWSFVVNNYLLGKEPPAFDLLYWNSDSTRMPRAMHSYYLRNMYQHNRLREPDGITLDGVPIDLSRINTPAYLLSTREDHIAPWQSTYAATQLYSAKVRFVLAASGHIAGVINPPAAKKYGYWTNEELPQYPEHWLEGAQYQEGSWWLDWKRWISRYNGKRVPARSPGDGALSPIEDAPGRYVKVRIG